MKPKNQNLPNIAKQMFLFGSFDCDDSETIFDILKSADDLYHNGHQSFLEDHEYDTLRSYAQRLEPNHSYFLGIGAAVRGGKVTLPYTLGSLDQIEIGEIDKWVTKWNLATKDVAITDKLDGISAMIVYDTNGAFQIGYSRGDGERGADISRHLLKIQSVPKQLDRPLVIRGEIIIKRELFFNNVQTMIKSRSGQPYKNPRNAIAGLMNAESNPTEVYTFIDFVAYDILNEQHSKQDQLSLLKTLGFETPTCVFWEGKHLTDQNLADHLTVRRERTYYEIDGLVLDVNDKDKRITMNPTKDTLNPAYAVKYKVADANNQAVATVINVHWAASKHGYLKPRVEIEPIDLVGVTITYATGFNAKFIHDNKIGPGAKVKLTRSGDVIPFIQEVIEGTEPQMPSVEFIWNDTMVDIMLVEHNEDVVINRMVDFFATIDIPHLKKGNVVKLFNQGLITIEDIINCSRDYLIDILGVNGSKIYDGLHDKLTNIPLYLLLGAHTNQRGVGVRKMKKLQQHFGHDGILLLSDVDSIDVVEGFDKKTADKVLLSIEQFKKFVEKINVTFDKNCLSGTLEGSMKGQFVVFTGFRDKKLQELIELEGGTIQNSTNKKTTIVVAKDPNNTSSKIRKAQELGIRVLSIDQMQDLL